LSHARNRGIVESKGRYVAFTDDDAIAEKKWVASLHQGLMKYGCECVGGKIFLKTEKELPVWLNKELWGFLGYLDYGDDYLNFDTDHYPFGGNMVFARKVFDRIGFFDPNYGRKGSIDFGGEEYELFTRFLASGGKGMYIPSAIVYHVIGPEKLQKQYFRKLHLRAGEQKALNESAEYKRTLYGIPLFIFSQLFRSIVKYILKPTMRMQMNVWWIIGFIRGRIDIYSLKK
jgi:GT2 family glycosyltransferase